MRTLPLTLPVEVYTNANVRYFDLCELCVSAVCITFEMQCYIRLKVTTLA
jgi:hypothetical protein